MSYFTVSIYMIHTCIYIYMYIYICIYIYIVIHMICKLCIYYVTHRYAHLDMEVSVKSWVPPVIIQHPNDPLGFHGNLTIRTCLGQGSSGSFPCQGPVLGKMTNVHQHMDQPGWMGWWFQQHIFSDGDHHLKYGFKKYLKPPT